MKGLKINISSSCTSQDSTSILSSPNMDLLPSSSSPSFSSSSSSSFSTYTGSGRAIDRHNPIITDEKRSGITSSSCTNTPLRTPCTNNVLQQKPTTPISVITTPKNNKVQSSPRQKGNKLTNKLTKKKTTTTKTSSTNKSSPVIDARSNNVMIHDGEYGRRSFSRRSDLIMKASACSNTRPGVDYISPPESSRYLLDDTSFLEVLNDFDPVLKLGNYDSKKCDNNNSEVVGNNIKIDEEGLNSSPSKPSSCSASSEDQVVVLRVSLHCRGCERKMKKHLSRMAGVTSFNIDFAAKKVTVVGDVTPLGVLASISKVKTAKLWTPSTVMPSSSSSSSQLNSRNTNNMLPNYNNNQIDVKVA